MFEVNTGTMPFKIIFYYGYDINDSIQFINIYEYQGKNLTLKIKWRNKII